jgi:tRNA (guanine-N7-)-methyltransferase
MKKLPLLLTETTMIPSSIRSFVQRGRRITPAQQRALDTLWYHYGIDSDTPLDFNQLFGREAQRHLEIGCGMGEALLTLAKEHPERDYIGIDVYRPGIGSLLRHLAINQLQNVRLICADAVEILQYCSQPHSLDAIYLFFPDPWPKSRHHKRRLVQPAFVELLAYGLKAGGYVQLATDWQDYAQHMLRVLDAAPQFVNSVAAGCFLPRPLDRPLTKFEQRGQRLGHPIWDLLYIRK